MDKLSYALILVGLSILLLTFLAALLSSTIPQHPQPTPTLTPTATASPINAPPYIHTDKDALNWGYLLPGVVVKRVFTVINTGTVETQPLRLSHSESSVGEVAWNLEGVTLKPGQSAEATVVLQTYFDAPFGNFAIDITVTG